jgi:predicted outer membrane protein
MTCLLLTFAGSCGVISRNLKHRREVVKMKVLSLNGNAKKAQKKKRNPKMAALIAKIYESNDFTIEAAHKAFSGVLQSK